MGSYTLQLYKDRNHVIPLKLWRMVFTVSAKDNIEKNSKSNEATKHFHDTSICGFQSMKWVDDGIAIMIQWVGDFSLS